MNKTELKLATSKDWDPWITIVRTRATGFMIWDKINPSLSEKPASLDRPDEPNYIEDLPGEKPEEIVAKRADYRFREKQWQKKEAKWKEQHESFNKIIEFIYSTVTIGNTAYLQKVEAHPWDLLRALKLKLAPSDTARLMDLRRKYSLVKVGPKNRQSIETWLDKWNQIYSLGKEYGVADCKDARTACTDFIIAIDAYAPVIVGMYEARLDKSEDIEALLFELIEAFRQHIRMRDSKTLTVSNSAFATGVGNQATTESKGPSLRGKQKEIPECLCGSKHYWGQCDYLRDDRVGRPANFKPDPAIKKRVAEKLKDNNTKKRVDKALEAKRGREAKATDEVDSSQSPSPQPKTGAFCCFATSGSPHSSFKSSWLMDHCAAYHVCNDTMADRFHHEKDCTDGSLCLSGTGPKPVVAYGWIDVHVSTPTGPNVIELRNVRYVPEFEANIVAGDLLGKKGVHIDSQNDRMHTDGITVFNLLKNGPFWCVEDNSKTDTALSLATLNSKPAAKSATTLEWHQLLAHAGNDAIQNLAGAAEGVEVTDKARVPPTNECEVCALTKAHRIVSRSPYKAERSDKPFFRITYDLMQLDAGLNKHQWISHIACSEMDFQMVYTHQRKSEATASLRKAIVTIRKRFNCEVAIIRSDGEKALGKEFTDICSKMGITWEPSAPDTPAQNGHSERKGNLLSLKARVMREESGLPNYLWPWIYMTAGFLMNRTPMRKHGWKTPFEAVTKHRPNLSHLKSYGCKAYPLDKHIARKNKLAPRAHVGFLVGYEGTNIFNIWIPSQRKVIRTRDVTFNEKEFYSPGEVDLAQLIKEPFLNTTLDIPASDLSHIVTAVPDSSDADEDTDEGIAGNDTEETREGPSTKETQEVHQDRYLPSPSPSGGGKSPSSDGDVDENQHSPLSKMNQQVENLVKEGRSALSESNDDFFDAQELPPAPKPQPKPKSTNKSDFSEDNILPEGVTRRKKRKEKYTEALQEIAEGGNEAFHAAFASFLPARTFYETPAQAAAPATSTSKLSTSTRIHRDQLPPEPKNYHQMLKHPHSEGFLKAMQVEIKALKEKKTWREVSYDHAVKAGKKAIPTRWVYKYKFDQEGFLLKYKARLCARGDLQYTAQNTFAATLASRIFRTMMALMAAWDLESRQYDTVNAFANSKIDEPTYTRTPDGWEGNDDVILLLLQALYGLKQSPALWFRMLSKTLRDLGLQQVTEVECLFVNEFMILFFFVDDIAVIYDRKFTRQVDEFQAKLLNTYEMRYLGEVQWFLGLRVVRDRKLRQLRLHQDSYIDKMVHKFNVQVSGRQVKTPMDYSTALTKNAGKATAQQIYAYQQLVGSINFSSITTRPDIAFACSKLSEFLTNPSEEHQKAADRVLQYLGQTKYYAIVFDAQIVNPQNVFIASSDAAFADDPDTRRSSYGYGFKLLNGMVDWKSSKQKSVTTSSTEAELHAMSATAKEQLWWARFFEEINLDPGHIVEIECDNMQTIRILTSDNSQFSTKLRHVDVHRHWLRQEIQAGRIHIKWSSTTSILSDGLTKALPPQKHQEFVKLLGLQDEKPT